MSCLHFGIYPAFERTEQNTAKTRFDLCIFLYEKFVRCQDHGVEIVLSVRGGSLTSLNFQRNIHTSRILRSHRCFLYAEKNCAAFGALLA